MRYALLVVLVLLAPLFSLGCGDDSSSTPDAGTRDASTPVDGGGADTGPAPDAGGTDAGGGVPDAGMIECFDFSDDPDTPLAIDGTFDATTLQWQRPHDDPAVCPATALLPSTAASVPFVVYAFCNNDTVEHTYDFEMLSQDGPMGQTALDDPYLILYEGIGIPADPLQCLAVNDDIPDSIGVNDSEITGIVVPPGGAITMVGTTFTFDPGDGTGAGYYVLVATNAD